MQEVRLRSGRKQPPPHVHGVKDYRQVLNFKTSGTWIDKTPVCMAVKGNCEPLCLGYQPSVSGSCVFQSQGPFRIECSRGRYE